MRSCEAFHFVSHFRAGILVNLNVLTGLSRLKIPIEVSSDFVARDKLKIKGTGRWLIAFTI